MGFIGQIIDFLRPQRSNGGPEFRKRVEWLMLLRLIVTSLLLGITIFFQLRESPEVAAEVTLPLYILIGAIFLLSIIYSLYLAVVPDLWILSFVQVMVDLVYGTVLIHFTGGATSVFTVLYVFPILTSGILHLRRGALFTASVASLMFGLLINLEFYDVIPHSSWPWVIPWSRTASFYILWVMIVNITSFFPGGGAVQLVFGATPADQSLVDAQGKSFRATFRSPHQHCTLDYQRDYYRGRK